MPYVEKASAWVCFGNTFIKMDSHECVKMLEQGEAIVIVTALVLLHCSL